MENTEQTFWRKCSTCKNPIAFGAKYYICSVSTCNGQRTGYVFCNMTCFESHVPGARHRDAGAISQIAPQAGTAPAIAAEKRDPVRRIVGGPATAAPAASAPKTAAPQEVLIIASRLKEYIQARSEMNTSASVMDVLSAHVRVICDRAIENARADGRKTVMDRDFEFLKGR